MIKISKAKIEHSKDISEIMQSDLKKYNLNFPKEIIDEFIEHAEIKNIIKEFENPELIGFVSRNKENITGFIVGYKNNIQKNVMIHYITGTKVEKEELLEKFIKECKSRNFKKIITDTFEFMDNNDFFKSKQFILTKKEEIAPNLEMLWYELNLN